MRKYLNKSMQKLAAELTAGLARLKKQYVDSAEELYRITEDDQEYPMEFALFRITGYRGDKPDDGPELLQGKSIRNDLLQLILDVCDSAELSVGDYDEKAFDTDELAKQHKVSTKTVQRWRKSGLVARRLIYPDGKRRICFLNNSIEWFRKIRPGQVDRSSRFSQMTEPEREQILQEARTLAVEDDCSLSEIAKRLAAKTGRAAETIRYTIRRHDQNNPDEAIFPERQQALDDREKLIIYRSFLAGVSVPGLAKRFGRTRGSIYRVVNEMRARQLLEQDIQCIYNPQFDLPNADEWILGPEVEREPSDTKTTAAPGDLPPYL